MKSQTTNAAKWVVVVSETMDDETTCQVVSEEYETKEEAEVFAADVAYSNPGAVSEGTWLVEVCTAEEAAEVVTG